MNAFISYSHQDTTMLNMLHKHLAQLQRDQIITTWSDNEILAGGKLNQNITSALQISNLFIALISPDYIASNYCYEKEFERALEMEKQGVLTIVPIILEPSDWFSTPFKEFKALPKDGKAVSTWENKNTAFLNIIQNIRKLIESGSNSKKTTSKIESPQLIITRNYRVQKDFDTIEKMEFVEKTFHEVKEFFKRYIEELLLIENIKTRTLVDDNYEFKCLLINRNKINTESQVTISIISGNSPGVLSPSISHEKKLNYLVSNSNNNRGTNKTFTLAFDEFHLFWLENDFYSSSRDKKELESKAIANTIWNEWLESVGIL